VSRVIDAQGSTNTRDPEQLRVAIGELRAVHSLLAQHAEISAGMPSISMERAAGIGDSAMVVARFIERAEGHLHALSVAQISADVIVLDADRGAWVDTPYGQPILPMVSAPTIGGLLGVCSGVTRLAAGESSGARVYPGVDVIMVTVYGAAMVAWWDLNKELRRAVCRRHQHAYIARGTPHAISNPSHQPLVAVLARSGADLTKGVEPLPELDTELRCLRARDQNIH
jgi:uncharacterized RmlC-like cupin family protein